MMNNIAKLQEVIMGSGDILEVLKISNVIKKYIKYLI